MQCGMNIRSGACVNNLKCMSAPGHIVGWCELI